MKSKFSCLVAFGELLALAGCGGGSDGSSTAAPQTESTAPTPAPSPASAPTAGTRATCNLANFEAEVLASVNAYRAAGASCGSEGTFPAPCLLPGTPH